MSQRRGNSKIILLLAGVQAMKSLRSSEQTDPDRTAILSLSSFIFPFFDEDLPALNPRPGLLHYPYSREYKYPLDTWLTSLVTDFDASAPITSVARAQSCPFSQPFAGFSPFATALNSTAMFSVAHQESSDPAADGNA